MMNFFEHIEAYCENTLSSEDKALFEKELASNTSLLKEVNAYFDTKKMSEALLDMDILEAIENAKNDKNKVTPKANYVRIIIIGLIAVLASYGLWSSIKKSGNSIKATPQVAEMYKEPIWPIVRSSEDTLMQEAMYLFLQKGDVESAKTLILKDNSLDEEMRRYWVAEMYLKGQKWDSVAVYLPSLSDDHVKKDRVEWMKELVTKLNK